MRRSLRSWLWRVPVDEEVDEEIAFHLEMRIRELVARGMDRKAAREMALARLGDVSRLKRTCVDLGRRRDREMRITQWIEELGQDVTFALRQLRASPSFALVATITLALGIGANSAIFALVDAALLRPLPYQDPDRLVMVWESTAQFPRSGVAALNFRDWNERNRTFEKMAGMFAYARRLTTPGGTVEQVPAQQVTTAFFDVLGVRPILGRTFRPSDEALPPNVTVLSERLWNRHFGGDPGVVGQIIRLDSQPFMVLGIVPASFQIGSAADLWTVWTELPGMDARGLRFMRVVGRLKADVSMDAASSDMTTVAKGLEQEYPASNAGRGVTIDPLRDGLVGREIRLTSILFVGVVGFVLLMCCANVANLLLARMGGRARELAIRSALGAGRKRIVAQILTESVVLALLGGVMAIGVGTAILRIAPSIIPAGLLPPSVTLAFDGRVIAFCAATALFVGVMFGLAPAWQSTGTRLVQVMMSATRGTTRSGGRFRSVLVAGEVATAVLLLCGAGLLLRTLVALDNVDGGHRIENALTMQVTLSYGLPTSRHKTPQSMLRFYQSVEQEVTNLPGVRSAGWGSGLPLDGFFYQGFPVRVVGQAAAERSGTASTDYLIVSPAYLRTLGVPVLAGRTFDDRDVAASTPVCLVSDGFVRKYLRGQSPLGMRVAVRPMGLGPSPPITREIVGVVAQTKGRPDAPDDATQLYVPMAQNPWADSVLVVQPAGGSADALAPAVRAAIARVDREQPVTRVRTLDQVAWESTARQRFRAALVAVFAALALVLAMVGVFGVLAYAVQQRWREFGVRIALGANVRDVLGLVVAASARVVGAGVIVGLVGAALAARSISIFLYGVQPWDLTTFAGVAAVLVLTAAVATLAPALRATRVDPVIAFRAD